MSIVLTNAICKKEQIHKGSVTLGCDSEGAIKAVSSTRPVTSRWNSYDILERIKKEIRLSTVEWKFKHVYGHQDKKCKKKTLDIWATTNIAADKEAKRKWARYKQASFPTIPYNAEACGLWRDTINGKTITKKIPTRIYNHRWIHRAKSFWKRRFGITSDQVNMIDWSIFKRAQNGTSQPKRMWRTKHMSHTGPTGVNLHRRKDRKTEACPHCIQREDNIHLLQCTSQKADDTFRKSMEDLDEWMTKKCNLSLKHAIDLMIRAARTGIEPSWDTIQHIETRRIAQLQWELGPPLIMWGIWHRDWANLQKDFFKGTRKSPKVWFGQLSNEIWKITTDMWTTRNEAEHKDEKSRINMERDEEVNTAIDDIYDRLPDNLRILPHDDQQFFAKKATYRKQRKLNDKIKWVKQATRIIQAYEAIQSNDRSASLMIEWLRSGVT